MFLESPFDPADFATFRRQETTLIVLNLAVLAALAVMHLAFVRLLGPPPRLVLVGARGALRRADVVPGVAAGAPRAAVSRRRARLVARVGLGRHRLRRARHQPRHVRRQPLPVLFVLPLLSAAFRFSFPAALATHGARLVAHHRAGVVARGGPGRRWRRASTSKSVTMALIYMVVTPVVAMLVRGLRQRELELRRHAEELQRTRDRLVAEEKFAAVGRLASAVAHEIRNPVATIVTSLAAGHQADGDVRAAAGGTVRHRRPRGRPPRTRDHGLPRVREAARGRGPRDVARERAGLTSATCCAADAERRDVQVAVEADEALTAIGRRVSAASGAAEPRTERRAGGPAGIHRALRARGARRSAVTLAVENAGPADPGATSWRACSSRSSRRAADGTGLGLSIARNIAGPTAATSLLAENARRDVRFDIVLPRGRGGRAVAAARHGGRPGVRHSTWAGS